MLQKGLVFRTLNRNEDHASSEKASASYLKQKHFCNHCTRLGRRAQFKPNSCRSFSNRHNTSHHPQYQGLNQTTLWKRILKTMNDLRVHGDLKDCSSHHGDIMGRRPETEETHTHTHMQNFKVSELFLEIWQHHEPLFKQICFSFPSKDALEKWQVKIQKVPLKTQK